MHERTCSTPGCERKHRARGLCATHYNQQDPNRHRPQLSTCAACGAEMKRWGGGGKGGQRHPACSDRCRSYLRWGRWPKGKEMVGPVPRLPSPRPAWTGHAIPSPRRVFINGACLWCGETFTATCMVGGTAPRYCSRRCSKARAGRGDQRFNPSPVLRRMIYERDKWICQLCFTPVDRGLDPHDNWAPSLDHIECQSWTLIPDHSAANLRLAHRWCNAVRSDERWVKTADLAPLRG